MKQNKMRAWVGTIAIVLSSGWAWAGSLDSPATPSSPDSAMFTLNALYHRLNDGNPGSKRTDNFTQPSSGPASTGHTIDEIMAIAPSTNTFGAIPSQVLAGTVYWGVMADAWGEKTGSMPNRGAVAITPSATQQAIQEGYHNGSGSVAGDADLVTGNIRAGVNLFGVAGKTEVVDTTTGDAAAGDILSGKKAWVDGLERTGTIATRTLSGATQTVAAGYYAATTLSAVDADLVKGNIRAGVNLFGVAGKTEVVDTTSGDAAAGDILSGKKAWVDGLERTGTIATRTLSGATQTVAAGYYAATTLSTVDADLVKGNIRAGVNLFGVAGKTEVVDTTTGDAAAGDIRSGKKAWVDGAEITGSIATRTLSAANQTVNAGYYAATTLGAVDTDLAASNIAEGVTIFGLTGTHEYGGFNTGDVLVASANTQRSGISKDVMKKVKSIRIPRGGKFRFNWKWRSETTGNLVSTQIRRNGVIVGQLHGAKLTAWQTEWEDIGGWSANDTAELWVETNSDLHYYVQDFRIYVENPYNWAIVMD